MKATKPPVSSDQDKARVVFDGWIAAGLTDEQIAVKVRCTSRSVQNWRKGGRISRLAAWAILAAAKEVKP